MIPFIRFVMVTVVLLLAATPYQGFSIVVIPSKQSIEAIFNEGILLFEQQEYAAAQECLEAYLHSNGKKYKQEKAAYYVVLAALANKDPHVATILQHFVVSYPQSVQVETVRYHLAKFFFQEGEFHQSLSLYEKIKAKRLAPIARTPLQYELANTYLQLKDWSKAKAGFLEIKNKKSPYYYPAQLHIAYIAFEQGDYCNAMAPLQEASKSKDYLMEAKSLTLKVFHRAGAFESLLSYVKSYPESSFTKQDQLFIADAYFFLKQYEAAVSHYQSYLDGIDTTDRESCSKLAHALYETQQYPKALACFKQLLDENDHASQVAAYYSGLIYEKEGAIQAAMDAFSQAEKQKFDPGVRELAYIKQAGLLYQKGAITEVISSITTFIQENKESKNLSTAQTLLVQCYYKTKAYKLAMNYIAALPYKNETLLRLYQKVLFYQGLEEYNSGTPEAAIKCLKKSMLFPFKQSLVLQAEFWTAEALSSIEKYKQALKFYARLIQQDNCNTLYHEKTLYGLAYAYFNTGNYATAAKTFEQYLAITQKPSSTHYDAALRLGDCYYVKKNYDQALKVYENVYTYHPAHVRYQEALIYQILGDNVHAQQCIQEIITNHAQTQYYAKALYHEACTIFNAGDYETAIQKFSYLIQNEPMSSLQPELFMKRALSYENIQKKEEAFDDYITILEKYPTHCNAESALIALSNLFAAQGTPEKIAPYLQKYASIAQQITSYADQRTIDAAKTLLYSEEYSKVLQQLASFHKMHPQSSLLAEAYFLMAESYYRLQKTNQAISYYKKVVASNQTALHTKAWLRMANLAYQSNKLQEALASYQQLQKIQLNDKECYLTLIGLIKTSFMLKRYEITTPTCLQLLNNPKEAPIEILQQARLYLGKIAMQRSEYKNAKGHFLKASTPLYTVTAAEAQYLLAHAEFKLKAYKSSLNVLFELTEKFPHNKNYIDNAFLLMADNYIVLDNFTQAKATLDSIIKQSKNKKTIEVAKKKRAAVLSKLKNQATTQKQVPIQEQVPKTYSETVAHTTDISVNFKSF